MITITETDFEKILRSIRLPIGQLLDDGSTYRVSLDDFVHLKPRDRKELSGFEKFLVLTDNGKCVVGGILFYGPYDIQAFTLKEFRGMHFMSNIHRNGILKSECYHNQMVSVEYQMISSYDDFLMKHHLLSCAGLQIKNLGKIYDYFNVFRNLSEEYNGFQNVSREEFIDKFSI